MKITKIILLMFSAAAITSCGVTPEQAAEYNDKIIHEQKAVDDKEIALIDALKDYTNVDGMKEAQEDFVAQIKTSIEAIKKLDKFDGETYFADAAVKLFEVYQKYAEKDYKEVVEIYSLPDEEYTTEMKDRSNDLLDAINDGINAEFTSFKLSQDMFAAKYNLRLTHSD